MSEYEANATLERLSEPYIGFLNIKPYRRNAPSDYKARGLFVNFNRGTIVLITVFIRTSRSEPCSEGHSLIHSLDVRTPKSYIVCPIHNVSASNVDHRRSQGPITYIVKKIAEDINFHLGTSDIFYIAPALDVIRAWMHVIK